MVFKKKQPDAAGDEKHFSPDYRVSYLSGFGLLGIVLAMLFLSYRSGSASGSVFHEVEYFPREVVDKAIQHLTDSLRGAIGQNRVRKIAYARQAGKSPGDSISVTGDSVAFFSRHISEDSISIGLLEQDRIYYEDSTITDSNALRIVTKWTHFGVTPDMVARWDVAYQAMDSGWHDSAQYYARLPLNNKLFCYKGIARFGIASYKSNSEFLAKYPDVGVWIFMMVILCGFCFIVVPSSIYIRAQILQIFKDVQYPKGQGYWVVTVLVTGLLLLFLEVLFHTFSDAPPIRDLFFMRTLGTFLNVVNVIGCIAGGFCLAGFVHSSSMLGYFANKLEDQTKMVKKQREVVKKMMAPSLVGAPPPISAKRAIESSDAEAAKHEKYADQYRRLLGFFHRYFILSAILLSLVVLCTGALFNAANSMTFLKLLTSNWGYSPAGGDAVYLFGGLFTAVLMLVFLPAKMQFGDVQLNLPKDDQDKGDDNKDGSWYSLLQQPFSWLKGGLIAATPFLSGLIQGLLGLFMKH